MLSQHGAIFDGYFFKSERHITGRFWMNSEWHLVYSPLNSTLWLFFLDSQARFQVYNKLAKLPSSSVLNHCWLSSKGILRREYQVDSGAGGEVAHTLITSLEDMVRHPCQCSRLSVMCRTGIPTTSRTKYFYKHYKKQALITLQGTILINLLTRYGQSGLSGHLIDKTDRHVPSIFFINYSVNVTVFGIELLKASPVSVLPLDIA